MWADSQGKQQLQRHWGQQRLPAPYLLVPHGTFMCSTCHKPELHGPWNRSQREVTLGRACLGRLGEGGASHPGISFLEELELEKRGEGRRFPMKGTSLQGGGHGRDPWLGR